MTSALDNQSLYLLHLLSCALRGEVPAPLPTGVTWDGLFALARWSSVTTTCAFAVASSPEADSTERTRWQTEADQNLMRHAVFDMEREAVFAAMDEAGLAYLPLKGVVTSRAYPRPEMRWMCDNDFLFGHIREDGSVAAATEADARELRRIMEGQGFTTAHFGMGNHDSYEKAPFLNFEPHRVLANPEVAWWKYYADPWAKARRVEGASGLAYEFAREDAYLFHIAHMFKHFSASGHGVRGLADEWALERAWGGSMDRSYLDAELQKLGMADFEADLRRVAQAVVERMPAGVRLSATARRWRRMWNRCSPICLAVARTARLSTTCETGSRRRPPREARRAPVPVTCSSVPFRRLRNFSRDTLCSGARRGSCPGCMCTAWW